MTGQAIMEVLGVLVVAFVLGVIIPLSLIFTFVKHRGGSEELYQTAAAVKTGKVSELLPWGPSSLSELTREWVGHTTYTASMFGRNDQAAGRVPSTRSAEGWLLAFCTDSHHDGADGKVLATSSMHRVELRVTAGVCHATLNGAAVGSFKLGEPALLGPDGASVGSWRRATGQLTLRGREVATLDPRTAAPVSARSESPGALVTQSITERTAEDEAWTLVVAVFHLAWVAADAV
jgi:hypothetical protein